MDGKRNDFEEKGHGYFVQKDKATQMQEALYYLQTEIDSVKESAAKSVDIVEELRLLKGEVDDLAELCRADLYALNDKIENSSREQSRNAINATEEFKKFAKEEKDEIAALCKSLTEKMDVNFGEMALSLDKLSESVNKPQNSDIDRILSEMSEKLDCLFDAVASMPQNVESKAQDEVTVKLLEKLETIEGKLDKTPDNTTSDDELFSRLEKLEVALVQREEENSKILNKLDELIKTAKNTQNVAALTEYSAEAKTSEITPDIALKLNEKLDFIIEKLSSVDSGNGYGVEGDLADNDDVMRMLEKLNNQVSVLLSDNRDKISEIKDELDRFKDNFTTVTGGGEVSSDDDLKASFESLTSELDTLSRLITIEKNEDTAVPTAVLSASSELSKAIEEMTDEKEEDMSEEPENAEICEESTEEE